MARKRPRLASSGSGFGGIAPILIGILLAIIVPFAIVVLLNSLAAPFFANLTELVTTLTGVSTGSDIGDVFLFLFGVLILPIVAVVFFVSIAIDAFGKKGGSGV